MQRTFHGVIVNEALDEGSVSVRADFIRGVICTVEVEQRDIKPADFDLHGGAHRDVADLRNGREDERSIAVRHAFTKISWSSP